MQVAVMRQAQNGSHDVCTACNPRNLKPRPSTYFCVSVITTMGGSARDYCTALAQQGSACRLLRRVCNWKQATIMGTQKSIRPRDSNALLRLAESQTFMLGKPENDAPPSRVYLSMASEPRTSLNLTSEKQKE